MNISYGEPTRDALPKVNVILAQDAGCGIGLNGRLPWEGERELAAEDMKMFRELTTGRGDSTNAVIMGYNTWVSIPPKFRPLKGRTNIVMTASHYNDVVASGASDFVFPCWEDALMHIQTANYDCVWVIGGVEVYRAAFVHFAISEIHRTIFKRMFKCDKYIDIEGLLVGYGLEYSVETLVDDDKRRVDVLRVIGQTTDCQ